MLFGWYEFRILPERIGGPQLKDLCTQTGHIMRNTWFLSLNGRELFTKWFLAFTLTLLSLSSLALLIEETPCGWDTSVQIFGSQCDEDIFSLFLYTYIHQEQKQEQPHRIPLQGHTTRTTRLAPIQPHNTWGHYSQFSLVTSLEPRLVKSPVFSLNSVSWGGKVWESHWNTHLFLGWPNPKVESQLQFSWVIEFLLYYNLTTWVASTFPLSS